MRSRSRAEGAEGSKVKGHPRTTTSTSRVKTRLLIALSLTLLISRREAVQLLELLSS